VAGFNYQGSQTLGSFYALAIRNAETSTSENIFVGVPHLERD